MTDNTKLLERLRTAPPNVLKDRDAADAITALQAEVARLRSAWNSSLNMSASIAEQRDAALARLAELESQKPVGMFFIGPVTGLYQPVHQDRPEQVKDYIPLYAAAGASPVQPEWLLESAQNLAVSLARKHYPEVPEFEVLGDLAGVISQIDNMTTGMQRAQPCQALEPEFFAISMPGKRHDTGRVTYKNGGFFADASSLEDAQCIAKALNKAKQPSQVRNTAGPEKIEELANRIDHEELWRRAGMDRFDMTPAQQDRLDAGVNLRRYADLLGSNCWRIYPPKPSVSYRAETFEGVVAMVRRTEERRSSRAAINAKRSTT